MNQCVKPYGRSRWKGFCSLIDHLVKNILHIQYADGQIDGGWLFQEADDVSIDLSECKVVTKRKPTTHELEGLQFGW